MTSFESSETTLDYPGAPQGTFEEFTFTLVENPDISLVAIYSPMFALVLLNLFIAWQPSVARERFELSFVSSACHFIHLQQHIWDMIGPEMLHAVSFPITSTVVTCLMFVCMLINRSLYQKHTSPPKFFTQLVKTTSNNRLVSSILGADCTEIGHRSTEIFQYIELREHNRWPMVVKFIDRVMFVVYVFIYFVLFCKYIHLDC
uniref:Neurotransmitter-gated ion-channel transmembrane domain-containing protein n=1 Tax=Anopheles farauti TaxID=69004 RepID=A0A182Q243_9DIPT